MRHRECQSSPAVFEVFQEDLAKRIANGEQPCRGLGDVVARVTRATGIDKLVKRVTGGKDCGCKKRREKLNRAVPFKAAD